MRLSYLPLALGASSLPHALAAAYKSASKGCDDLNVDVAIIGGGASGIHAAIHLKDAGAKVAVIEEKSQIGGHAETYINPDTGIPANVGVVVFEDTEVVQKYFDRLGVATTKTNPIAASGPSKSFDFSLGIPIPEQDPAAAAAAQQAFAAAIQAYSENVLSKYPWIDQGYLLPDPVPEELTLPFAQFAQQNNFSALLPIMSQFNWYPGNISTISTLYGIKNFGPGLLKSITGNFIVPTSGDTRSLYRAAAAELGDSVLLDSSVVFVQRRKSHVSLFVQQPNHTFKRINARKLLVAIPQTLHNIGTFDLSSYERSLFAKFSAIGYVAGVAEIPGLNQTVRNVGALTPFNVPVIPGSNGFQALRSPDDFLLGIGFDSPDYTNADAEAIVRKELATLAAVGAVPADAAKKVKFPFITNHAPFNLRVSSEDIGSGFYRELLGLEGERNTYWTGAAFAGHNSGLIWTWNEGTLLPALKKDLGL